MATITSLRDDIRCSTAPFATACDRVTALTRRVDVCRAVIEAVKQMKGYDVIRLPHLAKKGHK